MPRIIFKCRYLKNTPKAHLANLVEYVATREGVEKVSDSSHILPATKNQQKLISEILKMLPDTADLFEYEDYLKNPTRENASEFISIALENSLDLIGKKKNFVDYIANRPRVEKLGNHGLFTDEGVPIVLSQVAEEVSNHTGNVWTNIVSLRREDASRLGYDNAKSWQDLIRAQRNVIAENMKIAPENLRWYAAFHNESHHPHIHLIAYSINPKEAYVTKQGIENMRGSLAREIFRQDLMQIYEKQTERRNSLNRQSREAMQDIITQIRSGICENKNIEELIARLAEKLKHTSGKKQYGYLKAPLKEVVNQIVDELAKDERVTELYSSWYEMRNEVLSTYVDKLPPPLPLSQQKEFKSIKNMVIAEALNIGSHHFTFEPDEEQNISIEDDGDIAAATTYFEKSAKLGNVNAQYMLGRIYLESDSEHENVEKALQWLGKAADNGNALAQYAMGKLYLTGNHLEKDAVKAVELLTKSAEQGNQYAQYALGKLYLLGHDVRQDKETALHWLSAAAAQGNIYAKYLLERMDSFKDPSILLAATRLMHHLGNIFREEYQKAFGNPLIQVDRKLRKKLMEKKLAQGHAYNDHAPHQSY
ncbi:serine threonine protein phosphatase 5 [Thermacetogenium phaeum DSM 12270]|uniref:Serine threonine protein phosphatase 5 n=1 Tax=Thermacetogenium phaeum (strain ATCC BAA-254 / DSM 26808 / PB) TaxID=1089553 RepID=K4LG90_THEPS|nr:MobP3 family relaxase [Thermacetogenium phaeum]AFV10990.1 serine threonine protein phosphatase 5 [Thermacetogenium phaeum DSM 12270]